MHRYYLLVSSAANRVYAADSPRLLASAVEVFMANVPDTQVQITKLAGKTYVQIDTSVSSSELSALLKPLPDIAAGFFSVKTGVEELLRPLNLAQDFAYPDDLLTIQKYRGKTNESWTRLGLALTISLCDTAAAKMGTPLKVLDPLCGRGTTLNAALLTGHEPLGADIDVPDIDAYYVFLKTWLRTHRLKHRVQTSHMKGHKVRNGSQITITTAPTTAEYKAKKTTDLRLYVQDARTLRTHIPARSVDVIFTDTPYGVRHAAHHRSQSGTSKGNPEPRGRVLERSPSKLLDASLDQWREILRPGGSMGISYNRTVLPPVELAELLTKHGFSVESGAADDRFRHRVDSAIDRDLFFARRTN